MTDVYGKYSLGSGAILSDPDAVWRPLADPDVIASYRTSMLRDLAKSGIAVESLKTWSIMDVGTGRQALAFLDMGAKHVDHFDISPENVARVDAHIASAGLSGRMTTTCCDLVEHDLAPDSFDFVYLNGIVQHFSDVGKGVVNAVRALREGGHLWLYFYRSGTFDNFVLYMLRTMVHGSNVATDAALIDRSYREARTFFSSVGADNYLTSAFMDGVHTRYARLYDLDTYLRFAALAGLEVVSSSGIDPLGRAVDHEFARAAGVLTLRKTSTVSEQRLQEAAALLAPSREVNQLDPALADDPAIQRSLALYQELSAALAGKDFFGRLAVMRLFAFLAQTTRAPGYEAARRHPDLQSLLTNLVQLARA